MVDVKKVTASVKKPIYYFNQNSSVVSEVINFNPTNNPVSPISNLTVYTIDPFVIFTQEDSKLKVKIPFTRFYRLKYAITLTDVSTTSTEPDRFSVSKPVLACSEQLKIKRDSNGIITEIQENVYTQDGSGFIVFDPVMSPTIPNKIDSYSIKKNLNSGIIEGIVELYAGDVLTFEHTRTIFKKSDAALSFISGGLGMTMPDITSPYLPRSLNFDILGNYLYDGIYPSFINVSSTNINANVNITAFSASAAFFFEISEITDL